MDQRTSWLGVLCLIAACEEMPAVERLFEDDLVVTARDVDANFAGYQTFAIARVAAAHIGLTGEVTTDELDAGAAEALISEVSALMSQRGYQRVDRDHAPELGVAIGVFDGTRTVSAANTSLGGGGGGYASYALYPDFGYYYPYTFTYVYRAGALALLLLDLNAPPHDAGLPAIWTSIAYGAFPLNQPPQDVQVRAALEQAFRQSPYLRR